MDVDPVHDRASITAVEEEDRISNLPDEIIYRILSFLDMKYAIQTSTLSKKWKHIWMSMSHLNLNSQTSRTLPLFAKFVKDALSHRNHRTEVSAVELSFRGAATQFNAVVRSIVNYAYSNNVRQLTVAWFRLNNEVLDFPKHLFSCDTLKHLTLATHYLNGRGLSLPKSAWDFPSLETLNLSNLPFGDYVVKSLDLFSKCVKLKDLTLHQCFMYDLDIFYVSAPQLSNLTVTNTIRFPKVFKVVAPQLENLTASVGDRNSSFLQLSTEDLNSLDKVNLSMEDPFRERERYAPGIQDLFQKFCNAKCLILDKGIIEVLSACLDQLSYQPCPFNNLKCLKQKDHTPRMPIEVRNYLLESSPSATFIMDLRQEVDKGTMSKKVSKTLYTFCLFVLCLKALFSCTNQLLHEPSLFNNLKCLNQTDHIPRKPTKVNNKLLETSPSATFNLDLPHVPHKRSRQETDNGTMTNTLEEEKQQTKTVDEEKSMLETKISMQDKVIAEQKTMLEAMKVQHEKRMLEAKIHMQDEIIAQQKKAMLETTKLLHENGLLEEKFLMQDKVIAQQKAMLEMMKLENEKKMYEAKILKQDKIIAQQKATLEGLKLHHEKIETELGNIDS